MSTKRFFNGPDNDDRARAILQYAIDNDIEGPLYIITTPARRDSGFWTKLLDELGWEGCYQVDSWYNLGKYKDVDSSTFIFDGDNVYHKAKWTASFLKITKSNKWYAAAGYNDSWYDHMWLFIACGFYKNKADFQREHIVFRKHVHYPIVDCYINVDRLRDNLNKIVVLPPYTRGRTDE